MTTAAPTGVRLDGTDLAVAGADGETVLLHGLRSGWDLPYECASGGCGSCRVVLVYGQVRSLWPQAHGLTERDRRKGDRILACQSVPVGECVVRLPGGEAPEPSRGTGRSAPERHAAQLVGIERLSAATLLVTIEAALPICYLAGQFVVFELPDGTRRAYSMSREPGPDGDQRLEFVVRLAPGGRASAWFGAAAPGLELVVEGPYGRAHIQSPADRPVLLLGGGSGLGPVLALAERCLTEAADRPVRLYYGARDVDDAVLVDRLRTLAARGCAVEVVTDATPSAADAERLAPLRLRGGLAVEALDADHPDPGSLFECDLYLAGPTPMVDAVLGRLVRAGRVAANRTFFDRFL